MYDFENCQFCGAHKGSGEAMSGICDTCKRKKCYMQHDGNESCPLYIKGKPSNYKKLFGTPERAAQTMALQCFGATPEACDACVFSECDGKLRNSGAYPTVYDALLEWMKGDA